MNLLIWFVIYVLILASNYKKYFGVPRKIVINHFAIHALIFVSFYNSFSQIGWFINHFRTIKSVYYQDFGILPAWLSIWVNGFYPFIGACMLWISTDLMARKDRLSLFSKILPLAFLLGFAEFIGGATKLTSKEVGMISGVFGVILFSSFYIWTTKIYSIKNRKILFVTQKPK